MPKISELTSASSISGSDLIPIVQSAITKKLTYSSLLTSLATTFAELTDLPDLSSYLTSVSVSNITATGTPNSTTFLRGDGVWGTPPSSEGGVGFEVGDTEPTDTSLVWCNTTVGQPYVYDADLEEWVLLYPEVNHLILNNWWEKTVTALDDAGVFTLDLTEAKVWGIFLDTPDDVDIYLDTTNLDSLLVSDSRLDPVPLASWTIVFVVITAGLINWDSAIKWNAVDGPPDFNDSSVYVVNFAYFNGLFLASHLGPYT
jgi:hypothetical protein